MTQSEFILRQLQKAYEEKQQQEEYKKLSEGSEL